MPQQTRIDSTLFLPKELKIIERQIKFLSHLKQSDKVKRELRAEYKKLYAWQGSEFNQNVMGFRSKIGSKHTQLEKKYLGKIRALRIKGIKTTKRDYCRIMPTKSF